jgi:hypothetical protein
MVAIEGALIRCIAAMAFWPRDHWQATEKEPLHPLSGLMRGDEVIQDVALLEEAAPKCRVLMLPVFPWRQSTLDGGVIARLKSRW